MTRIIRRHRGAFSRATFLLALVAAAAALFATGRRISASGALFTPGNLIVYRVGTGSGALVNTGNPVVLDEYTPLGVLKNSVTLPSTGSSGRLIASGTATSEGLLTRSVDGLYLLLAGYDAPLGTSGLAGTTSVAVPRVVSRVDAAGSIDTTTRLTDWASANNPRGVASTDGFNLWVGGAAGGVRYATLGVSTSTQLSTTVANIRGVEIFNGQLYNSDSSQSVIRIGAVGNGLPTTSGQTITNLPGFANSTGSPYAFFFADLDGTPGVDTLYVADDTSGVPGGITKYSLVSGNWVANGTAGAAADAYRGLTGVVSGSTVTLYATRKGGAAASGGGELVSIVDATGYDGAFGGTPTLLATAASQTAFRGIALAPNSVAIGNQPVSQTIVSGTSATLSVTAGGLAPFSYQWYVGTSGDTSNPIAGGTGASFTTPVLSATTQSYWVRVSSGSQNADSVTVTVTAQPIIISAQPQSQTIASGGTATIGVAATGDGTLSYQWYFGSSGDTTDAIAGGTSNSYTTPTLFGAARYWVQVNSSSGAFLNSQAATIAVSALACTANHIPIHQVQGSGAASTMAGQIVTVKGVVVGDYEGPAPALRGFYMQDLPEDFDSDPATSEGIFVFESNNANSVSLGQVVQVTGIVAEYQGQTEIDSPSIDSCGASATPTPTDVTLPVPPDQNGVPYLERFEGMLVRFHQTLYVTEHYQLGRFGQIVMSSGGRLPQPTSIVLPGAAAVAQQTANSLNAIIVDDGDNKDRDANDMDPILFGRGGNPLSASNTLRGGDTAADIVGVMTYGWAGNSSSGNAFRLRPINALGGGVPHFAVGNARPNGPPNVNGSLKVVGMNVLNYFLTLDIPANVCGPTGNVQECRGANTDQEKTRQQGKLNAALVKLDADIIGMSELENTTGVDTLGDIVGRLNTTLGSAVYSYITYGSYISDDGLGHVVPITGNSGGTIGTDDIRVGLVYKTAKVAPIGVPLVNTATIHNRPPVAQLFSETATGERFTVVVNHYRSKGCSSNGLTGDADSGDGQGCFNATRVAQSQALLQFIQHTVLPTVHDPDILLVGDFNAYAKEDPIRAIEAAGFTNLISRYSGPNAYSYLFSGQWGYIDQALASTSLVSQIRGAGDYHINADEPSDLDYNTEYKSPALVNSLYNVDEFRISDHDPVVIGVSLRPSPQAVPDHFVAQSGSPLNVSGAFGVLSNDTGGPLSIFSHTSPAHGTLTLNADGSFVYTPAPGFFGTDSFNYTINNTTPAYLTQLLSTNVAPLGVFGGVTLTGGGYGSSLYPVPGSPNEFYGLTDRGPNVDDPTVTFKVEPIPSFAPAIGKFRFDGDQAVLEQVIPLRGTDGTLYNGLVNSDANTGETIDDLNGVQQPASPYGYDSEGLVALPDGTFWVSDEYGPFITHFDQNGVQIGRLSPFDGTLPYELSKRLANRGMEGLTITPDGTMLVGMMQSALVQGDLSPGFNVKKITPVRIVTYRLSDGAVHEYIYLLDDPGALGTAVSEITALSNTTFLVDERDGNFPPNAYKRLYKIDITGATDVGPLSSGVPNSGYNGLGGGLLINGKTIEFLLKGFQTTAGAAPVLTGAGITPVTKTLALDVVGLLTAIDPQARVFGHDKIEGVAALNGGATLVLSNDSDFGISGSTGTVPPGYQLVAKITPSTGLQDDGEFLVIDLVRSDGTVTIEVDDTIPPQTELLSTPTNPSNSAASAFTFAGTDSGSGVSSFECSIDGMSDADFAACASGVTYTLAGGNHTFAVRAVDAAGNKDPNAVTYPWTIDTVAPDTVLDTTPSAVTALTTAAFNFHGTDAGVGVSSFQCQIDTGAFAPCSSGVSYAGLAQGGHTFSVYAIDGAGNRDPEPATFAWIVDTTAPETAFDSTPGNPTNSRTATFTFHGADASTTTFECSVDGATFASCASGGSYSGLADGAHTFQVRAVDAAGNVDATPALFTWTVDATAPETVIDVTPANPTSATTASFTFHAMDAGTTTFECSLDSGAFAACASGVSYTGVADGGHSFNVRATDNVGNVDATPAQFAWAVDTTAPNTLIDTTPSALTNTAAAAFSFHSTDAGGSTFQCSLDSAAFANCASGIAYAGLADGVHTFAVKASDALGNTDATPAKYSWTVDTTPPVIAPHADVSATATSPSGAVVTYTPPAAHDVIGGDGVATCAPASGSPFAVGQTQVTCTASDAAGNAAAPTHFTVTVSPFVSAVAHFVAFSKDFTWLRANSTAITGDVGANQRRRPGDTVADDDGDGDDVTVRVGEGAAVQQRGSRVVGDTVQLLNKSSVHNIVDNFLLNKKGTILGSVSTTMTVPFTTLPAFPSITPGAQNMTVARNKTVTLAAGNYGAVHVNAGGTLVLTGGVYQMLSLDLDQSATVLFHAATQLLIKTELDSGSKATLIPDPAVAGLRASQMVIYVEGRDENCRYLDADDDGDDAGPTTVNIGPQSVVQANIYAANGTVWLKSKTQATGAFVGVHVRIGVNAQLTLDSAF